MSEVPASWVEFEPDVLDEIRRFGAAAYPYEGCGALLGKAGTPRRVTAQTPLPNTEKGKPRVRFEIAPRDYMRLEEEVERRGLTLLGFWHSHPDHPARPSPTDRAFAWEGLLTVIVSVLEGRPQDLLAWEIAGLTAPFTPVEIREARTDHINPLDGSSGPDGPSPRGLVCHERPPA